MRVPKRYKRPCRICEEMFLPLTPKGKLCKTCKLKINLEQHLLRVRQSCEKIIKKGHQFSKSTWYQKLLKLSGEIDLCLKEIMKEIKRRDI